MSTRSEGKKTVPFPRGKRGRETEWGMDNLREEPPHLRKCLHSREHTLQQTLVQVHTHSYFICIFFKHLGEQGQTSDYHNCY